MFESLINFFYIILYQPLFNSLILLYNYIPGHDFGIAIILFNLNYQNYTFSDFGKSR